MRCNFPQHHGGSEFGGSSGAGGGLAARVLIVVALAALLATVITAIIHVVAMILTFVGLGASVAAAVAVPLLYRRWRAQRAMMAGRYVPYMQPAPQRPQFGTQYPQQPSAVQGPTLNINLAGASPEVAAEVMRQIRGR